MRLNKTASQNGNSGAQLAKPPIVKMLITQLVVLFLLSAVMLFVDVKAALSALIGGLISVVPNAYFSYWAFKFSGARAASSVAQGFYRGEAGKFLLTVVLFASVFAWYRPINVMVIFLAYIFMTALNWILALRFLNR